MNPKLLHGLLIRKYIPVAVINCITVHAALAAALLLLPSLGCLCEGFWGNHFEGKAPANENSKSFPLIPWLKM